MTARTVFLTLLWIEGFGFIVLSMGLLPREKEANTLEVLLVSVRSHHGLLLMKFIPVCIFVGILALAMTQAFFWLRGGFSPVKMLIVPYLLAVTAGMFTVVLSTYFRNQYAAAAVAVLVLIAVTTSWIDPTLTFYEAPRSRAPMRRKPNLGLNRVCVVVLCGFLYDHAVRRLKRVELWMR